jgi:cellulose synthase/poly-beta-1,6-N-acetylglucosamine synthase-like glycosyltransferase
MTPILLLIYDFFRFGFFGIFVGLHAVLMAGLILEWMRDQRSCKANRIKSIEHETKFQAESGQPLVSVIIPVHNESLRMADMLKSVDVQDYPQAEFIFIDDRSTDDSAAKLKDFIHDRANMRLLSITENSEPNHKQYALGKGLEIAKGDFILFTDADCEIPSQWISSMVKRMAYAETGAVIGPVFKKPGGKGFFHLYQCFEHAVRYMYLAASTGIGAAGGGFGNNLILRRKSLDAIGGYAQVPFSPTEDAALIAKIRTCSDYKIRAAVGADLHVLTLGESNWKSLITQTLRWNNGGLFSPDMATRLNFGFLMITISMGILAILALPFIPSLWPLSLAVLVSMTANTIATLVLFGASLPKKGAAYIIQCVFTPMYFTFLTILGLCGIKPKWKDN